MVRRFAAIWILWVVLVAQAHAQKVSIQDGNVCIFTGGETKKLTNSGHDSDPVLAPDGK